MTVLDAETAMYVALMFAPEGTRMTIYTRYSGQARTAEVAVLRKEPDNGGWGDWQIISRPKSADATLLPVTIASERPQIVYSRDLADALTANADLWADVAHD